MINISIRKDKKDLNLDNKSNIRFLLGISKDNLAFLDRPISVIVEDIRNFFLNKKKEDKDYNYLYMEAYLFTELVETLDTVFKVRTIYSLESFLEDIKSKVYRMEDEENLLINKLEILRNKKDNLLYVLSAVVIMVELERPELNLKKVIKSLLDISQRFNSITPNNTIGSESAS